MKSYYKFFRLNDQLAAIEAKKEAVAQWNSCIESDYKTD